MPAASGRTNRPTHNTRRLFFVCLCGFFGDILGIMVSLLSLVFIFGVIIFFIASATVVFHFVHYRIGKRQHQIILFVFVAGALALFGAEFLVYSGIQWDAVNTIFTEHIFPRGL